MGGGLMDPPQKRRRKGVGARFRDAADYLEAPASWLRPDDSKKTLPEQWAFLHSRWRFATALVPYLGPPTHTLSHVLFPVLAVMAVCVGIKLAEGKVTWELDQYNNYALLFRYSSFVLSLLLAFRLNRTYDRWWAARCAFGGIGGGVGNLVRQVATYSDDPLLIRQYQKWGMCLVYGILQLIRDTPKVTDPRVPLLLEPHELALYQGTTKPSKLCGTMLSALTANAGFGPDREIHLNEMLGLVAANVGMCARIKLQSMPFGLTLFSTGWTLVWLLLLPLGVFPEASWSALLPVFTMATMMLGLEDLANQMEEPFQFFAYEAMVSTTAKDMPRTVNEVQACRALLEPGYRPPMAQDGSAAAAGVPPWPTLAPLPQRRGGAWA
ncbi:MAG: Bestrophin, RFP-TM, chloride channel-domain-containing protein [Monoraphidium minutum]|nr:MAG: Bestrophin, RFP-TM, chloride channel-domain-containing protein [Monoraphidium minutum]